MASLYLLISYTDFSSRPVFDRPENDRNHTLLFNTGPFSTSENVWIYS